MTGDEVLGGYAGGSGVFWIVVKIYLSNTLGRDAKLREWCCLEPTGFTIEQLFWMRSIKPLATHVVSCLWAIVAA